MKTEYFSLKDRMLSILQFLPDCKAFVKRPYIFTSKTVYFDPYLSVYCWHLHAGFDCCGSHFMTPFWFLYFLCKTFLQFRSPDRPFFLCTVIFISEFPFLAALNGHFWTFWLFLSSKLSHLRFHMSDTKFPRVTLLTQTALNGYFGDLLLKASWTIFELHKHSS